MRFNIGPFCFIFKVTTRPSQIKKEVKSVYSNNIENRVDAIRTYRQFTGASLKDAISYFNEEIASVEHQVKIG